MNLHRLLRIAAIAEGISYISFAITMPLKYIFKITEPNFYVGSAHGFLFLAYCVLVGIYGIKNKSKWYFYILGWAASLIPFGTFWFDAKFLKKESKDV